MSNNMLHKINVEDIYEDLDVDGEEDNDIIIDLTQVQWIDAIIRHPSQRKILMFTIHFIFGGSKTIRANNEDYQYRIRDEYRKLIRAWEEYKKHI